MAGLVKPRNFALRKITDTAQRIGRIFQQLRYPEQGGFSGASKYSGTNEFKVTPPTSIRTAEKTSGRSDD